jgi:aminoglycoside phosphotransferase family enzyme
MIISKKIILFSTFAECLENLKPDFELIPNSTGILYLAASKIFEKEKEILIQKNEEKAKEILAVTEFKNKEMFKEILAVTELKDKEILAVTELKEKKLLSDTVQFTKEIENLKSKSKVDEAFYLKQMSFMTQRYDPVELLI